MNAERSRCLASQSQKYPGKLATETGSQPIASSARRTYERPRVTRGSTLWFGDLGIVLVLRMMDKLRHSESRHQRDASDVPVHDNDR
jgi:hypothetical protein